MKRMIGSVVVVAAVLFGTAACGGDDKAESGSATTAAAGGASAGIDTSGAPSNDTVTKLCDLVDQIVDAATAKDTAKVKELADQAKPLAQEATKSILANPASAKQFGECSSKLTKAIAGVVPGG